MFEGLQYAFHTKQDTALLVVGINFDTYFWTNGDAGIKVARKTLESIAHNDYGSKVVWLDTVVKELKHLAQMFTEEEKKAITESYRLESGKWYVAGITIEQSNGVTLRDGRTDISIWEFLYQSYPPFPFVDNFECLEVLMLLDYKGELLRPTPCSVPRCPRL